MFIQAVSHDVAAEFVQAFEDSSRQPVYAGSTAFVPCRTAANEDFYVMFDALGSAAIISKWDVPTLNS